jgi:sulfur-oxidizing protein SoxY
MHKKRMGKMRFKQIENGGGKRSVRLIVSHPNNTGMQRDQLTTMFIPEHYVKNVKVSFNKELILEAETNFTLSENPNFTFTFDPEESGILRADLLDNLDNIFSIETEIMGHRE